MKTSAVQDILVKKRDGRVVPLDPARIYEAMAKAFHADMGLEKEEALSDTLQKQLAEINQEIVSVLLDGETAQDSVEVERIQDMVEMRLMKHGHYRVARRYIVYREEHARQRALRIDTPETVERPRLHVRLEDGSLIVLDESRIYHQVAEACRGLEELCDVQELVTAVERQVYNAITPSEIARAMVLSARSRIERDPAYDTVASRLMLAIIYREALGRAATEESLQSLYEERFENYIQEGIEAKRLTPKLGEFDIALLAKSLKSSRDAKFPYLGLQTIYDRYLLHVEGRRIEAPQYFWMRVAMGLAIEEGEQKNQRALEFYDLLSSMRFTSATPTLFNSGTCHPQLSSCYLTTVLDDLEHIFKSISDNAKLSKWAGGLGNDWTSVRATNSHIKGTNGQSQGVIPFLKVVNDAALAVNQGGKRKGAVCSYLE
ncbi:MAG: ATP cone domain-containing protein, partial [Pirellulaceae bacterium]|nr:ATP cone domain-containing protein [Pirellulaceae bacterium]